MGFSVLLTTHRKNVLARQREGLGAWGVRAGLFLLPSLNFAPSSPCCSASSLTSTHLNLGEDALFETEEDCQEPDGLLRTNVRGFLFSSGVRDLDAVGEARACLLLASPKPVLLSTLPKGRRKEQGEAGSPGSALKAVAFKETSRGVNREGGEQCGEWDFHYKEASRQ